MKIPNDKLTYSNTNSHADKLTNTLNKILTEKITYTYEKELVSIIDKQNFTLRFLGDDYINKKFTGDHLNIKLYFINRDHGWSTTKYKKLISESIKKD